MKISDANKAIVAVLMILVACQPSDRLIYKDAKAPIEKRVEDLLDRMTLEEKMAQTLWVWQMLGREGDYKEEFARTYAADGLGGLHRRYLRHHPQEGAKEINEIQRFFVEETRLGIPVMMNTEGNHGVMTKNVTIFPSSIGLSCSWDEALFERIFTAVALEARTMGMHQFFSPSLDVVRDPRWGRTDENYGEDPYLMARLGTAFIKAVQGEGPMIDRNHVSAVAKPYIVHGWPEGGVNTAPAHISRNEILNGFLAPFEAAIREADVTQLMLSYHEIGGTPVTIHQWLVKDILRDQLGYEGVIMSDYNAIPNLINSHHVAESSGEAAILSLKNSVDVDLSEPPRYAYPELPGLIREGTLSESLLDESVRRILRLKFKLGLFEDPYARPDKVKEIIHNKTHKALAVEAACKSMVLLKNEDNTLPLDRSKIRTLAVIGPNVDTCQFGNYAGSNDWATTVLDGMIDEFGTENVRFSQGCRLTRRMGLDAPRDVALWDREDNLRMIREAVRVARDCDAIILALGSNIDLCREAGWRNSSGDRSSLQLVGEQDELVEAMLATGKPVIVLLFNGRSLAITNVNEKVPAILECWHPGEATGTAVADILVGRANPSGKLTITFPASVGHIPSYYNRKPSAEVRYLVDTREYLYPFGYGLSYTTYEYGKPSVEPATVRAGESTVVSLDVTNSGSVGGDEIVQLYIRDLVCSVTRPVKELKDFRRVHLEPGETRRVEFEITPEKLKFYNADLEKVLEPGEFLVMTGPNSVEVDSLTFRLIK